MDSTPDLSNVLNYAGIFILACLLPTQLVFVWFHWRRRDRHPIAGRYPRLVFMQNMVIVPMTVLWGSALVGGVDLPCFFAYGANAIGICLVLLLHTIRTIVLLFQGSTLSRWEQSWFTRHRRLIQPRVLNRIAFTGAACCVIVFGLLAAVMGDVPHPCSSSTATFEITSAWIVLAYAFCQIVLLVLLNWRLRNHGHDAFGTMKEYRILSVTLVLWLLIAVAGAAILSHKYIAWWFTAVLVFAFGTFVGVTTCWPVIISMLYERKQVASLENLSQLSELLAIPKGFTVFLKFAITEFSSEYVLFWKCAEDLRTGLVQTAAVDTHSGEEQRKAALTRRRSEDASNNPLVAQLPPVPAATATGTGTGTGAGAGSASSSGSGDKNDSSQMNTTAPANGTNPTGYSRTASQIDPPFRNPVLRRNATANECLAEARRIYDTYVRIGSPFEVSLGIEHRVLIEQRLRELQAALNEHDEYRKVLALSGGVDLSRRYETPQRVARPAPAEEDVKINVQSPSGVMQSPGDLPSPSTLPAATVTSSPMHAGAPGIASPTVMWATARPSSSPGLQLQPQPVETMVAEADALPAEHAAGPRQPHGLGRPGKSFSANRLAHNSLGSVGSPGPATTAATIAATPATPATPAGAGTGAAPGSPPLQPQSQADRKTMRERRKHEKRELEKQVLLLKEPSAPPPALRAEEQLLDEIKHLFDEAQSEVVLALQGGTFPRFKASEIYQSFLREYKGWIPTGGAIRLRPLAAALPPRPAVTLPGDTHAHAAQPAGNNIELLHPGHRPDFASSMMSGHFTQTSALMASMNPLSMSHDVSLGIGSFGSGGGGGFGGRFGSMRRLDAPVHDMLPNSVAD